MDLIESELFVGQIIRAIRNAVYFAVETRIPHGVSNIAVRPLLFPDPNRPAPPWRTQLNTIAEGAVQHSWILVRIAVIFKSVEKALSSGLGGGRVHEWHTAVAGGIAGYLVFARDKTQYKLKQQINLFIAMRTMWALAGYATRNNIIPWPSGPQGKQLGWEVFATATWAAVMWHWRHHSLRTKDEMPKAMARSMDFIYQAGDKPGLDRWFTPQGYVAAAIFLYQVLRARRLV